MRRHLPRRQLVGDALDEVRRDLWQQLRRLPDDRWAKDFKGARWCLLKNPADLTDRQADQLARIRRNRGGIWRAYEMKEQFRADLRRRLDPRRSRRAVGPLARIFRRFSSSQVSSGRSRHVARRRISWWTTMSPSPVKDRGWCARAQRSRLAPFVKAARTMRHRRDLILNAVEHGISNGRVEGLNNKVRLIVRRAYGFHSADAALALVMLAAGPIHLHLPHEHPPTQTAA